jgi:hypothetical protein
LLVSGDGGVLLALVPGQGSPAGGLVFLWLLFNLGTIVLAIFWFIVGIIAVVTGFTLAITGAVLLLRAVGYFVEFLARLVRPGHEFRDHYIRPGLGLLGRALPPTLFLAAFAGLVTGAVVLGLQFEATAGALRWVWEELEPSALFIWWGVLIGGSVARWIFVDALLYCLSFPYGFVVGLGAAGWRLLEWLSPWFWKYLLALGVVLGTVAAGFVGVRRFRGSAAQPEPPQSASAPEPADWLRQHRRRTGQREWQAGRERQQSHEEQRSGSSSAKASPVTVGAGWQPNYAEALAELGFDEATVISQIAWRKKYRELVMKYHPDTGAPEPPMKRLNIAWAKICAVRGWKA